jgi:mono/diheme cytochrome c family protein
MMKGFILGVLLTVAVIIVGALFVAETGRLDVRADQRPPDIEWHLTGHAMDASVDRNAPKVTNPLQPTNENLIGGATIYLDHCAVCHGDPVRAKSPLADTLYPPPPQFMTDMADMPENENYYITVHGIRWTGMPGWKSVLNDHEIWQVVTFLGHMGNLPPQAKAVFALPGAKKQ